MKLTNMQYRDMSKCLGKQINENTDFAKLSLELQNELHDMVTSLNSLISMNRALINDNEQLIEQNKYLLKISDNSDEPSENRILN